MSLQNKSKKAHHPVCSGIFRFVIHPIVDELTDTCSITLIVHLYQLKVKREVSSTVFSTPVVHLQVCRRGVCFRYYQPVELSIICQQKHSTCSLKFMTTKNTKVKFYSWILIFMGPFISMVHYQFKSKVRYDDFIYKTLFQLEC